ncbi:MAG: hypothetical protein M1162_01265 [Candidatus Thermoplasmatota archaeon]|nr:hypothetical protein [Candidatus Thermoplasmatota archaeon]
MPDVNLELSLSIIFRTVESALFSSAGGLWYVTVKYGLSPGYAYLGSELSAHGYLRIYNFFFNTFVSEIVYLVMILAALYLLFRNSVGEPAPSIPTLARLFFSFSLAIFAFTVCIDLMRYTDSIYTYTWNGLDTDWYALMPLGSSSNATGIQDLGSTTVISLLFITSYFVATGSLLSMLEIRQAIILVLMVILPVSSLLLALPFTEKIAAGMWKLFAEMTVVPFIVLICIAIAASLFTDPLRCRDNGFIHRPDGWDGINEIWNHGPGCRDLVCPQTVPGSCDKGRKGANRYKQAGGVHH